MDYDRDNHNERSRSRSPVRDEGSERLRSRSRSPEPAKDNYHANDDGDKPNDAPPADNVPIENPGNNIYVANLSYRTSQEDLEDAFKRFGSLEKCQLILDPVTKESRGFAFITLTDARDAEDAIKAMDGSDMDGRRIRVELAKRNRGHSKTPGRYLGPGAARRERGRGRDRGRDRYDDRGGYSRDRGYDDRGGYRDRGYDRGYDRDYDRGYDRDRGGYDRGYDREARRY